MENSLLLPLSILAAALYVVAVVVYRLFFHPLAKVPGPKLLAITGLSKDIRHHLLGTWYRDVYDLHVKYGSVFRMAPNEVASEGDPAWDDCFSLKRSGKPEFIRDPQFFSRSNDKTVTLPSIFNTDHEGHRRQRRILAHAFSNNAMFEQEPIIVKYVDMFISHIHEFARAGSSVDIVRWFNFTTFDIIGDLTFGEPFDCLEKGIMHTWVSLIFNTIRAGEVLTFLLKYPLTRFITNAIVGKKVMATRAEHRALTVEKTKRRLALGPAENERKDFMSYILKHDGAKGMSENEITGNLETLIIAGSETTATALSGITYYLNKNPSVMQTLVQEVRGTFSSDEDITMKSSNDLTYAQACIEEGLRIFPPVNVSPPRVSPGDFVGDYYIPKNAKVSIHQWASYRTPHNWHRPNDFAPERFLPKDHPLYDPSFASDNRKTFRPFSYGPTDCLGKNLAYAELRLILAKLIWNFDIHAQPENEGWAENMKAHTLWNKPPLMVKFSVAKHE
ncbi:cytochrome P450 [Dendryphion nanum]|uniref:Cytochrome P450 n=1 Tax=Dendryphion nanum TaxID=256645 RepID=A0A9P9ITF8_9PLEO|nr:cytochrome P450 [Dendryphion nanum]